MSTATSGGRTPALRGLVALAVVVGVALVLLTPICGVLHRCGCVALWSGGEARCNVHDALAPHCPWCEYPVLAALVAGAVVAGQAGSFWLLRRRGALAGGLAALASFPVVATLAGALAWLPTDYPHYLVLDARARLHLPAGPIRCGGAPKTGCCDRRPG